MFDPASVRFRGPLTPYVSGFWAALIEQGYTPLSARNLLHLTAHLNRWLDDRRLGGGDLGEKQIAKFIAHRRREAYVAFRTPRALQPLLKYLRSLNVAPPAAEPVETTVDRWLREYGEYLVQERGLASTTVRIYTNFARRFIGAQFDSEIPDWRSLVAGDVTRFISNEFRSSSVGKCKHTVSELRPLLRYLHVRGWLTQDLVGCVPAVASWRLASLPKGLEPEQVERMLSSCGSRTIVGCRNRAVLCLLVRLGLRTGEVAGLRLDDIDWRVAEFVVRGKRRHESRLPLPRDVGKAVAAYLRLRPRVEHRAVFLCVRAPHRPITPSAISGLARRAVRAAGVRTGSAHVLRHTAATQMLRQGASLAEVGHVLRHRHIDTTAIYAKVDHASLRSLVRSWPGGAR